jgi:hypothetical protein
MEISFSGSCNCGALRFQASGKPLFQGFCQCLDCRKASSGHSAAITMQKNDVTISGEFHTYEKIGDSGSIVCRNFCPTCGSLAFNTYPSAASTISLSAALLDNPEVFSPEVVLYSRSALQWDHIDPSLPRSDGIRAAISS